MPKVLPKKSPAFHAGAFSSSATSRASMTLACRKRTAEGQELDERDQLEPVAREAFFKLSYAFRR